MDSRELIVSSRHLRGADRGSGSGSGSKDSGSCTNNCSQMFLHNHQRCFVQMHHLRRRRRRQQFPPNIFNCHYPITLHVPRQWCWWNAARNERKTSLKPRDEEFNGGGDATAFCGISRIIFRPWYSASSFRNCFFRLQQWNSGVKYCSDRMTFTWGFDPLIRCTDYFPYFIVIPELELRSCTTVYPPLKNDKTRESI